MFLRCLWGSKNYADPTNDFRLEESGFHSEPTFMDDQQLRCAHFHGDASCDILFFFSDAERVDIGLRFTQTYSKWSTLYWGRQPRGPIRSIRVGLNWTT